MKKTILLLFFTVSALFADIKKYNYNINDSITTFLVINYYQIFNEVNHNGGEHLSSLFNQLHIKDQDEKIIKMKEILYSDDIQFNKIRKIKSDVLSLN